MQKLENWTVRGHFNNLFTFRIIKSNNFKRDKFSPQTDLNKYNHNNLLVN
jgi:hypothetical protein